MMFVVIVPLRHLKRPQFAARGYQFDRADMLQFVRRLRRLRVGEEVELVPTTWAAEGHPETHIAWAVDTDTDELEATWNMCTQFKITTIPVGTREQPEDVRSVVTRVGMTPVGGLSHAV